MTTRPKSNVRPFGSETPTLPEIRLPSVPPPPPKAESWKPPEEEPVREPTTRLHRALPPLSEPPGLEPGDPRTE